jgi:hypothetical protein
LGHYWSPTRRYFELIAYDPLLHNLQTETQGISIPEGMDVLTWVKICCVAYADDLQPVSSSPEDLQLQLDIIFEFLTYVMTNIDEDSPDFPNNNFTLGDDFLTRILGVYMTMESAQ